MKQESLLHHWQHSLLKNSLAQLFDFVFNSISLFWEQYFIPKHCTRQLDSPYQRCRLVEGVSLSSLLWRTKVNLAILRNFTEQWGDTTLSWKRVTRKSFRLRSTQKKVYCLTQHALLSQPTPRKKEKGGSNYNKAPVLWHKYHNHSEQEECIQCTSSSSTIIAAIILRNLPPMCHLQLFCLKISLSIMGLVQQQS